MPLCYRGWQSAAGEDGFYCMAKGTFGERLKRERELREVTLEEVSTATRISARFLEALENEDWAKLPGGVFGHGFVRSIARYLGLSEESLLAEYDLARGENLIAPSPKPEERIPAPPKWIPIFAVLVILLLLLGLVFAGLYAWKKYRVHRQARPAGKIELRAVPHPLQVLAVEQPQSAQSPGSTTTSLSLDLCASASSAADVRVVAESKLVLDAEVATDEYRRFASKNQFEDSTSRFAGCCWN